MMDDKGEVNLGIDYMISNRPDRVSPTGHVTYHDISVTEYECRESEQALIFL